MKIAITGGRGKMGHAVTDLALDQGYEVVTIDIRPPQPRDLRRGTSALTLDVTHYEDLEDSLRGCDALIHLAAFPTPMGRPIHETHNTNVVASYNALAAASVLGIHHVCQASSLNATGASFSRSPRYDYLPLDEQHPTYNEDPYALSKWICEAQADSIARRNDQMSIVSLRLHMLVPDRQAARTHYLERPDSGTRQLWGYTTLDAVARASLLALEVPWRGHEVTYVVAPVTAMDEGTEDLCRRYYPGVPIRTQLSGNEGLFDCRKAFDVLKWHHDD